MPILEKILIIRFSSIGDILLASPLIRILRSTYPDAKIDFLVKSEYAELVKYNEHLTSVLELRTSEREELKLLKRKIRRERYTAIFDIHNSLRSRYLRIFSGAKYVRIVRKHALARFLLIHARKNLYPPPIVPVALRYLDTASTFGVEDDGNGLEVFIPDELCSSVSALLSKYRLEKHRLVAGFVPTSGHFTKRWLAEHYVELGITMARDERCKILIFGGREDVDYCGDIAQMINAQAGWTAAESFGGKFSLLETAAVFDRCHLVVSNDTGLMHLAAARKRKVVAIFGSTVREFGFYPYGTENIVVERENLYCRPCSHVGLANCPEGHFRCMKEIHSDQVLRAARTLLATQPAREVAQNG
ncbi:MAG TPA: lipopolysaccharide heptosyltransferase II [Bacteroidota bacterium]|nr:lipopolysaccharide heptosyltransferase II [Bacteroidota bacterium]